MAKRGTNLKALSEHLGLSQTTVSRALNGFPEVSEKTRERVREAASAFNYRPNPSAASLATGKARQIGHVIPLSEHTMINPHFSDFIAGAGEVYAKMGYDMLLRVVDGENENQVYRDFAERRRVDAVVVHGPKKNDSRIDLLQELELPFVVHGRDGRDEKSYSWLDVDNQESFQTATDHLVKKGHTRIALINGLTKMNFAAQRHKGYVQALQGAGIEMDPALVCSADMVEPYGHRATLELMSLPKPPTAILFSSILPAMGGARALNDLNIKMGESVDIITYDDLLSFLRDGVPNNDAYEAPVFTAIRSSIRAAGRRVAELLTDKIESGNTSHVQELWQSEFIFGRSTGNR